jgi:dinuclear metal center YbgI/SA1388 family protein
MMASQSELLDVLSELAPLYLSEAWDNTGLLLDVGTGGPHQRVVLTIDLTRAVLEEAVDFGADLIVAYHPPIFSGLKRLRADNPEESLILAVIEAKIPVYSPHTALDAAADGMADWLASSFGPGQKRPIVSSAGDPKLGAGRIVELDREITLEEATAGVKAHLGLAWVRVSEAAHKPRIRSIAVCPGAGGSLFERVGEVDLLLTGEMRHHDILARARRGSHVIVTDHSHSERGYLPRLAERLLQRLPKLEVRVSREDRDPLQIR